MKWLMANCYADWEESDVVMAHSLREDAEWLKSHEHDIGYELNADTTGTLVEDLKWLIERGEETTENRAMEVSLLRCDFEWLDDRGEGTDDDRVAQVSELRKGLEWLEPRGEVADEDRLAEVAELVANLKLLEEAGRLANVAQPVRRIAAAGRRQLSSAPM